MQWVRIFLRILGGTGPFKTHKLALPPASGIMPIDRMKNISGEVVIEIITYGRLTGAVKTSKVAAIVV